jgi:alkylated DNA repair dioxygenase AlkB
MKAPVEYIPNFVYEPDEAFSRLRNELEWERRGDAPRSEYYCNDFPKPYVYGKGDYARTYEPKAYHGVILSIRKQLEAHIRSIFDVCFLNRYLNQSDQLGWHSDDSPEMDDARPIVTVSLGVEREIWFRTRGGINTQPGEIEKLKLGHGSIAIMAAGMQDTHAHRIPKASFKCGERISLTFRGYVNR